MNKEKAFSRREFLVGAGAIAVGGLLAACAPSTTPTEAPPEEEAPAEEEAPEEAAPEEALTGELTFWMRDFWGGEMPEMIVEEYNKLDTGITVKWELGDFDENTKYHASDCEADRCFVPNRYGSDTWTLPRRVSSRWRRLTYSIWFRSGSTRQSGNGTIRSLLPLAPCR